MDNKLIESEKYNFFSSKKTERINLFKYYGIEIENLLNNIYLVDYNKFEDINYAFGKLESALNICDFLRKTKIEDNNDTDIIIITTLISLSESIYRLNNPKQKINENLVKGFFKPVIDKLNYKIKFSQVSYENGNAEKAYSGNQDNIAVIILYLIRNDYIHNGNFTGTFFLNSKTKKDYPNCYNCSGFYFSEKNEKTILHYANIECNLTYNEFLSIYLEAFKLTIEEYIKITNK